MKKQILTLFILFVFIEGVFSQPTTFLKTYSSGNMGYAVRETNSGDYVVCGGTDYYYNFHFVSMSSIPTTQIHLFRTTSDGSSIWEKKIGRLSSRSIANWEEITDDGGIIITGHENKETTWPPDSNDVLLIKCDSNGAVQWSKIIDSGKDELGFCVRQTYDGGYAISGFHDELPTSLVGNTYAMLIKTDALGNILWNKMYQLAVRDLDTGEGLPWVFRQTADSGFVLTGTTVGAHQADIYVIRTDAAGNVLWAKSYEHDNSLNRFSLGLDILENAAGEIIIAASMDKDHSAMEFNYPCILKLSSNGTLIQSYIYNSVPAQSFQAGFSSVQETSDGGYFFTGMGGYGGFGNQAQLLKTDMNFNIQWSRSYTMDGIATMGSRSGRSTSDGSYIFTGKRQFAGTVLLKTDFIGLVPCKNPGTLTEITPSINTVSRFPSIIDGVFANDVLLSEQSLLIDTTTLCPVTYSHLPVELIRFTATSLHENEILIEWETASETNNDYFILEKSTNGHEFIKLALVNGNGNSSASIRYSYSDRSRDNSGIVYYRLRQIDYDGSEHLSRVIALKSRKDIFRLIDSETDRGSGKITFYLSRGGSPQIEYTVYDVTGRMTNHGNIRTAENSFSVEINTGNWEKGIYFASFCDGSETLTSKIIY